MRQVMVDYISTDVSKVHILFIVMRGFYISYKQVNMTYSLPRAYAVYSVIDSL